MRKKELLNSIIEICPVRNVVARFGNKWALLVILVSPRGEYSLTDTGRSLVPIILELTEWAKKNMKTIIEHRKTWKQTIVNNRF